MIRLAAAQDLDAVAAGYEAQFDWEDAHGVATNWVRGRYPTRATAADACAADTLWVLDEGGRLPASMILNSLQLDSYAGIPWQLAAAPQQVLVLHTLCVAPSAAGQGLGSRMVRFALARAAALGCVTLRLDTWGGNRRAQALYERLGFRLAGRAQTLFQGSIPEELVFYERAVTPADGRTQN